MINEAWMTDANCRDENPKLFDATSAKDGALKALDHCLSCPVADACRDWVLAPFEDIRSYYSGVAGGRVWIEGRDKTRNVLLHADDVAAEAAGHKKAAGRQRLQFAPVDFAVVHDAIYGRPTRDLLPSEKIAACVAMSVAGWSSPEIGRIIGLHPVVVRRYYQSDRILPADRAAAIDLGEVISAEVSAMADAAEADAA